MSQQLFRGRYSLGVFLLVCTIAGPAIGLTVKHIWFRERYAVVTSQSDLNWVAMLDMGGSRRQVMFAVVFPKGSNSYQLRTTPNPSMEPSPKGVDISPRGLHWNGSEVPFGSARKLFVWSKQEIPSQHADGQRRGTGGDFFGDDDQRDGATFGTASAMITMNDFAK